jgi:hypothetical protein
VSLRDAEDITNEVVAEFVEVDVVMATAGCHDHRIASGFNIDVRPFSHVVG